MQPKQSEWSYQWARYRDDEKWLFEGWIHPFTWEDFRGKDVLDLGAGSGQHTDWVADYARRVVAVDLNTAPIVRERNRRHPNVEVLEGDIARIDLPERFDIVYCIGVLHHTRDPQATFRNIARLVKPGGALLLWVYAHEGNVTNRWVLEPLKSAIFSHLPRKVLSAVAWLVTALMYIPVYTLYRLPLKFLPYHHFLSDNFRKLSFYRNWVNVFDQMNAPTTHFLRGADVRRWYEDADFEILNLDHYRSVGWRASGRKRA